MVADPSDQSLEGLLAEYSKNLQKNPTEAKKLLEDHRENAEFVELAQTVRDLQKHETSFKKKLRAWQITCIVILLVLGIGLPLYLFWNVKEQTQEQARSLENFMKQYKTSQEAAKQLETIEEIDRFPFSMYATIEGQRVEAAKLYIKNLEEKIIKITEGPNAEDPSSALILYLSFQLNWQKFLYKKDYSDKSEYYNKAMSNVVEFVTLFPNINVGWYNLGLILSYNPERMKLEPSDLDAALFAYEKAIKEEGEEDPGKLLVIKIKTRNNLAWEYFLRKELNKARQVAVSLKDPLIKAKEESLVLNRGNVYDTLAQISLERGDTEEYLDWQIKAFNYFDDEFMEHQKKAFTHLFDKDPNPKEKKLLQENANKLAEQTRIAIIQTAIEQEERDKEVQEFLKRSLNYYKKHENDLPEEQKKLLNLLKKSLQEA